MGHMGYRVCPIIICTWSAEAENVQLEWSGQASGQRIMMNGYAMRTPSGLIDRRRGGKTVASCNSLAELLTPFLWHGMAWQMKSRKAENVEKILHLETLQKLLGRPRNLRCIFNCSVIKRQLHKIKNKSWFQIKWLRQRLRRQRTRRSVPWLSTRRKWKEEPGKKAVEANKNKND